MSSTKTLCFLSALLSASDSGVICSATHAGFRVRRSKDDVSEAAGRRSATGPGNPYWKRPLGSTCFLSQPSVTQEAGAKPLILY